MSFVPSDGFVLNLKSAIKEKFLSRREFEIRKDYRAQSIVGGGIACIAQFTRGMTVVNSWCNSMHHNNWAGSANNAHDLPCAIFLQWPCFNNFKWQEIIDEYLSAYFILLDSINDNFFIFTAVSLISYTNKLNTENPSAL